MPQINVKADNTNGQGIRAIAAQFNALLAKLDADVGVSATDHVATLQINVTK